MASTRIWILLGTSACVFSALSVAQAPKPTITLDEYLNTTEITGTTLAPDASAAVIGTEAPDWKANNFRHDLWLWTAKDGLKPLTRSGTDERPQWSPDGKWIAFASDRTPTGSADAGDADSDKPNRVWLISPSGGEALPLYKEKLDVHAFAWSPDGSAIYISAKAPQTREQEDQQTDEWKDVVRWREQYRGDLLLKIAIAPALTRAVAMPLAKEAPSKSATDVEPSAKLPEGATQIAKSDVAIAEISPAPDGKQIAFVTEPIHKRIENPADYEIFTVSGGGGGSPKQLTHNAAMESNVRWSPDGRWIYFAVNAANGSIEGKYRDVQGRLYRLDPSSGKTERLGGSFDGSLDQFTLLADGREVALGLKGTESQLYLIEGDKATKLQGNAGSYAGLDPAHGANALLVRFSTITEPQQVYLITDPLQPNKLTKLTSFNPIFAERAQPEWQPYTWKSDDGQAVEGVLIFPPGKKGAKHLRMFTLIHGGPADADGNRFGANWYDWATFAADNGWLVFRPNYRGSTGYGDEFMLGIAPHLVSKPGRDILAGVDALVRDGYADGDHLAIGGYSYGGYMTNWLITQTTRFKSAVTGAGAVEHAANWGNDDMTWDDAWFLGGRPWENPQVYQSEAALFQFDKVRTPTHLVQGGADVRVAYLEGETMERALQSLGIPHTFLVFPGEGHSLGKNPWHGYIKVREELKWMEHYDK